MESGVGLQKVQRLRKEDAVWRNRALEIMRGASICASAQHREEASHVALLGPYSCAVYFGIAA